MNLTLFAGVLLAATMVTARGASLGEKIMQAVAKADEPDKAIREAARPASLDEKIMRAAYYEEKKPDGFSDDRDVRYDHLKKTKKICNDKCVVGPNYDEIAAFNCQSMECLNTCGMSCNNMYRSSDLFSGDFLSGYQGVEEIDQCLIIRCVKMPPFDKCKNILLARQWLNRKPARMPKECKNSPWASPENREKWEKAEMPGFIWN